MTSACAFADIKCVIYSVPRIFIRFGAAFIKVHRTPPAVFSRIKLPVGGNLERLSYRSAIRVEQVERHGAQRLFPRCDRIRLGNFLAIVKLCRVV